MVDFVVPFADLGDAKPQVNSTLPCQVRIIEGFQVTRVFVAENLVTDRQDRTESEFQMSL